MYDYNVFREKKNEDDITFIIFHNIIVGLVKIKRDEFTVGKVIIKLFTLLIEKFPSTLPILPELTTLLYLCIHIISTKRISLAASLSLWRYIVDVFSSSYQCYNSCLYLMLFLLIKRVINDLLFI